jgi:hypothetical protein
MSSRMSAMYVSAFEVFCSKRSANATIWSTVKSSFPCRKVIASIQCSAEDLLWWRGGPSPNEPLRINELMPSIIFLIPCSADAPLDAELQDRLLAYDETEAASLSSADCLRFETAGKSMEESRTGAGSGIPSSLLESGRLLKVAGRVRVSGPIPVATTVLLLGAVSTELAMVWRWRHGSDPRGEKH